MVLKTIYSTHLFYTRKLRPKERGKGGLPKDAKEVSGRAKLERPGKAQGRSRVSSYNRPSFPRIKPHQRLPGVPIKPTLSSVSLRALGASPTLSGPQLLICEMRPQDELTALGSVCSKHPEEEEARASSSFWSHTP